MCCGPKDTLKKPKRRDVKKQGEAGDIRNSVRHSSYKILMGKTHGLAWLL